MVYEATASERETLVVAGVESFDAFYLREYRHMVGLARGMCRDGWVAEDPQVWSLPTSGFSSE